MLLIIGATFYYLWQERNLRIFQGKARSLDELCSQIRDVVRLRVMSLKMMLLSRFLMLQMFGISC